MAQNETTLYFLTYNNYYNRIVKYEDTLAAYTDYQVKGYPPIVCNFDPADGIQTSHVLKLSNYIPDTPEVDYVVAAAADADGNEKIISRWFIMDADRKSATQWVLSLQRDLVVDFYETVVNTPVYIERAICSTGNNFIFNSDNLTVNQIKKQETILKDKTGCPWIVGYMASDLTEDKRIDASSENIAKPVVSDYTYDEWQNFQQKGILKIDSVSFQIIGKNNVGGGVFGEVPALRAAEDNPVLKTDSAGALFDVKRKIFLYLPSGHKGSYTIPAGMTMIGYYAFAGCRDLTRVNVPDGMGFIDDWVFHGCNRLTLISVPAEMKYFGDYVIPFGCKVHRP